MFASYTSDKGLIARIYRELKILNSPKINDSIKKWATKQNFLKGRSPNGKKTHEEMFTIPHHKENANQNHTKIPPHPCKNYYLQEHHHQQMLARMRQKRNPQTLLVGM
jgi:hypothetical protein